MAETNIINTNVLKLYTIGIVPMLCMVELFGLYLFSNCIKKALPFFSSRLKKRIVFIESIIAFR